jgi:hypothetical protein
VSYEFVCSVQGQHDGVWTQQNQANVALSLSPLQAFWERSYDCRPCITEVGMIKWGWSLPVPEPFTQACSILNQHCWLSSQSLSFRGVETNISCCHLRIWASEELKLHQLPKKFPILRLQKYLKGRGVTFTRIEGRVVWVSRVSVRLC